MEEKLTMRMETLLDNAKALCFEETDLICCLANLSALIMQSVPNINWAGFYLMKQGELILGPFQGKPACTHIALGQGVCGTAAQKNTCLVVMDVHQFPGHIACDQNSRSEIVVPLVYQSEVVGVLDIDAPIPDRFKPADEAVLRELGAWIGGLFALNPHEC